MIAIGCDHGGLELKDILVSYLKEKGQAYTDYGVYNDQTADYPDMAKKVTQSITDGKSKFGILICGTGIGMSMAANKVSGIRAAVCSEHYSVKHTRLHNDANVLCLGARVIGSAVAVELVDTFLTTEFEGGRHIERINKLEV